MYVSQLVRYARACCKYQDFVDKGKLLTSYLVHMVIAKQSLCQTVKNSMGDIMTSLIPTHMSVSKLTSEDIHSKAFNYRIIIFTDLFHGNVGMAGVL